MRQVFRPFSKIVRVETSDDTDTEVTLLDSSGNNLKCNYISVQVSGATFVRGRHLRIIPVIEGSAESAFNTPAEDILNMGTSGTCAVLVPQGGAPAEIVLSDSDRTDKIRIAEVGPGQDFVALITYGQMSTVGPMRDNERPGGI